MGTALYEVAAYLIRETKRELKRNCKTCFDSDVFCDPCEKTFLLQSGILKANLPPSKVAFAETNKEMDPVWLREYDFKTGRLSKTGGIELFGELTRQYIENMRLVVAEGNSIFLAGSNGCGKTIAAVMIALAFIRNRRSVHYCTLAQLHSYDTRSFNDPLYEQLLEELQEVDLLIVDEFGKERRKTGSVLYLADTYLKAREEYMRPTILITNHPIPEFKDASTTNDKGYGPSFWAMLGERYRVFAVSPDTPDLRISHRKPWSF